MADRKSRWFEPLLPGTSLGDRLLACLGAAAGIAVAGILTLWFLPDAGLALPLLVAPLGASAVLLFAVPTSPLAQPWPAIAGNVGSALIGVAIARTLGHGPIAGGVAVAAAIAGMSALRCLHPPGGAAALTAVIGGPAIAAAGYGFALVPIGINTVLLVLAAWAYHGLRGRTYPHRPLQVVEPDLSRQDIDAAVDEMGEAIDIDRDDLHALFVRAQGHARRRQIGRN